MERQEYLKNLQTLLDQHIIEFIKPIAKSLLKLDASELFQMSHIVLFSKSNYLVHAYKSKLIESVCNVSIVPKNIKHLTFDFKTNVSVQYRAHSNFYEIDLDGHHHYDRSALSCLIQSIVDHKPPVGNSKHIIVLNNLNSMSEQMSCALRNLLEKYTETALFLLTTLNPSHMSETIKSRCIFVNLNVDMDRLLFKYLENYRPFLLPVLYSNIDARTTFLNKCNGDPLNIAVILDFEHPLQFKGYLYAMIKDTIDKLRTIRIEMANQNVINSNYMKYNTLLREFVVKLGATCVPPHILAKSILYYVDRYFPEKASECVAILADMDHKATQINKHIFLGEMHIDKIVNILLECCV